ncbi:glycosyltransferase [Niallia taxi]|uniref:glycosyltransferase n=1 Tax=Niallia taxi TaxID=2499688 RepID=UPI00316BE47F
MRTIAYYVSDYGYGHAARSIAIIRRLLEVDMSLHIIVCTSFAISFLKQSLSSERISFRIINTDVGYYLNEKTIRPNNKKIYEEYTFFIQEWSKRIDIEYSFFLQKNIKLVISDISPLPFEPAMKLDIPTVAISNFTWYTAYKGIISEDDLNIFMNAYRMMTNFFLLAGSNEYNWGCRKKKFSFFSRKVDINEVNKIKELINPMHDKTIIYFGLGMKINGIDINSLPLWDSKDCVFIVSSNVCIQRENIFSIPDHYTESQHFIAASDLVISKAGWGTVSEAVINQIPLLLLNRKELTEDQNTIKYIKDNNLGEIIEWEEFINFQFEKKNMQSINRTFENELGKIIEELLIILNDR